METSTSRALEAGRADILVVDDNPANIELLVAILSGRGYRVRVANSGARALAAARADAPDLIMLDIAMPKMDGYEVCRQLKANPLTQAVPVIFLSALSGAIDKVQAFGAGGADYVAKPFQLEEVVVRVENQIKISHWQREAQARNAELATMNQELFAATQRLEDANARLKLLSESDGLTGLANRRLFDAALTAAWQRAAAARSGLGLILFDIDHFKQYNDSGGHLRGDDCLKRVATVLKAGAGTRNALVARHGGEEFAVLVEAADLATTRQLGDSLRRNIEAENLPHDDSPTARVVTVSAGISVMSATVADAPTRLFDAADKALYRAKQGGRNRVSD